MAISAPHPTDMRMLIAFDDTPQARRALEYATKLLRPGNVELITAWEPVASQTARALARTGLPQTTVGANQEGEDPAREEALQISYRGSEFAESLGLRARAHLVEYAGTAAPAITDAAKELGVDVIVAGTRGLSGPRSWFDQSTAAGMLTNAEIPLFIVPPEETDETGGAPAQA